VWLLLRNTYRHLGWLFVWAATVAYSRVYMGVHYPGDIIVGSLLGWLFGCLVFWVYQFTKNKTSVHKQNTSLTE
jgi:undecaprenyl-diphosphatase